MNKSRLRIGFSQSQWEAKREAELPRFNGKQTKAVTLNELPRFIKSLFDIRYEPPVLFLKAGNTYIAVCETDTYVAVDLTASFFTRITPSSRMRTVAYCAEYDACAVVPDNMLQEVRRLRSPKGSEGRDSVPVWSHGTIDSDANIRDLPHIWQFKQLAQAVKDLRRTPFVAAKLAKRVEDKAAASVTHLRNLGAVAEQAEENATTGKQQ